YLTASGFTLGFGPADDTACHPQRRGCPSPSWFPRSRPSERGEIQRSPCWNLARIVGRLYDHHFLPVNANRELFFPIFLDPSARFPHSRPAPPLSLPRPARLPFPPSRGCARWAAVGGRRGPPFPHRVPATAWQATRRPGATSVR